MAHRERGLESTGEATTAIYGSRDGSIGPIIRSTRGRAEVLPLHVFNRLQEKNTSNSQIF